MRTARRSSSSYEGLASGLRAFVTRRAQELIGLSLLAVAGLVAASLATWSVDDPSLNNATNSPVRNILGWPGAIVADSPCRSSVSAPSRPCCRSRSGAGG